MSRIRKYGLINNHENKKGHDYKFNTTDTLRKFQAAKAKLLQGETAKYNILCIGDSIVTGTGGTTPRDDGFVGLLRDYLHTLFVDTGKGGIDSIYPTSTSPAHTYANGWDDYVGQNNVVGGAQSGFVNYTSGGTISFSFTGTGVGIIMGGTSFAAARNGSISIVVDEDAPVVVDCGAGDGVGVLAFSTEITGLADSSHDVVITDTIGENEGLVFGGHYPIKGASGFVVHNGGVFGSTVTNWNSVNAFAATTDIYTPTLTIVELGGGNDWNTGLTTDSYRTGLQNIADEALTHGDCLFIAAGMFMSTATPSQTPTATQSVFRDIMQEVAIEKGCAFLDMMKRHNGDADNSDIANANGLLSDDVHFNDFGYYDTFEAVKEILGI